MSSLRLRAIARAKLDLSETVQRIHEAGRIAVAAYLTLVYKSALSQQVTSCHAIELINLAVVPFLFSHTGAENSPLVLTANC